MGHFVALEWLRSYKTRLFHASLFLLLWLILLDFPREVSIFTIDANWMHCLGHFLANRSQCGVDYVWTYGPLGYFIHHVYEPDLFWWKYAWEVSVKFALAWLLLSWADRLRRGWTQTAFIALALLFLPGAVDALYLFCLVLLGLLPLRDENWRTPSRFVAAVILLAVLALTKFTFLLLGAVVWAILVLAPGLGWRCRVALTAGYPAAWMTGWLLLGQSLGNIPRFLNLSAEIARGYGEAMAQVGNPRMVYAGLTGLALFLALLACCPLAQFRRHENLLGLALLSASMFLVWKHGFIRQDELHLFHFFGYLLLVPFAVEGFLGEATPPSRLRASVVTALVIIGVFCRGPLPRPIDWLNRLRFNGVIVLAPVQLKRLLDKQRETLVSQWALPGVRQVVGQESVDQISVFQGVLFVNQLNYRPPPIFQSYSAYTPALLQRNAAFYRSERAPTFVLCHLQPIDGHFPAMENGLVLLELFRRYRPVVRENDLLLLKRLADADPTESAKRPVLLQRSIAFEQEIRVDQLGSLPKLLSVRIEDSLLGWLRTTLFRPPPIFLVVHTQDGGTHSYRLIPGMAGTDFLLDPLLRDQADFEALYAGQPLRRVGSFSIHVDPAARMFFQDHLEITVSKAEELTGIVPARK